ncbi:MAG: M81 family metallopeptidase [Negativicutes bacterium]|nr:M81 family metallopeptidase [Negativicutes bacterium]
MKQKRVLIAEFKHETNSFCSQKTGRKDFENRRLEFGEEIIPLFRGTKSEMGGFIAGCEEQGIEMVPIAAVTASPGGHVTKDVFHLVKDSLLDAIRQKVFDGILLSLHGAMVTEEVSDGEGELLETIRQAVGGTIPVIATLDLHANVSDKMVKTADVLIGYDSYPHIDQYDRAYEAANVMGALLRHEIRPVMMMKQIPILCPIMGTDDEPVKALMSLVHRWEKHPEVISVSLFHGFPWSDVYDAGMSVTAVTNNDRQLAERITCEIQDAVLTVRARFLPNATPVEDAIRQGLTAPAGPVILADSADNPGGGGPSDGTHILRKLVEMGAENVGFATITDPEVVDQAIRAGVRSTIDVRLGGKVEAICGEPLECEAVVRTITDGVFINKGPMGQGLKTDLGRTVVLDINGIEVVVSELRYQPMEPEVFRRMGIEPSDKKILVLKSAMHYKAAFDAISKKNIVVDVPGLMSMNLKNFSFRNIRRPIFPFDE